jgi:hypothetical protein
MSNKTITAAPSQWFTLKIPKVFIEDHEGRGLILYPYEQSNDPYAEPWVVKYMKRHVVVRLHVEDALELISDADYYSTEWVHMGGVGSDFAGLGSSARATKAAVHRQMVEQGYTFTPRQIRDWRLR